MYLVVHRAGTHGRGTSALQRKRSVSEVVDLEIQSERWNGQPMLVAGEHGQVTLQCVTETGHVGDRERLDPAQWHFRGLLSGSTCRVELFQVGKVTNVSQADLVDPDTEGDEDLFGLRWGSAALRQLVEHFSEVDGSDRGARPDL